MKGGSTPRTSATMPYKDPNGHTNPTTNTDIYLAYFPTTASNPNPGWVSQGIVNNDNAVVDGSSSASDLYSGHQRPDAVPAGDRGRPGDRDTGRLVARRPRRRRQCPRRDLHHHQHRRRPHLQRPDLRQPAQTATDAITGQTDVLGPEADNQSAGESLRRTQTFGYGDQMGLAVFDGQVYPVWAGNFNQSSDGSGTVIADPLNIWYRPMVIAAGPRIINSTMGPIPLAEAAGGSVSISVTFDRPIIPSYVRDGRCPVFYHNTSSTGSYVSLTVTGVTVVPSTGNTQFTDHVQSVAAPARPPRTTTPAPTAI